MPIPEYEIRSKRVLTEQEAAALTGSPPRQAGDVEIGTWEVYAGGRTSQNEYYLREFPEGWKIIALAFQM